MTLRTLTWRSSIFAIAMASLTACAPDPPTLTPLSAEVKSVSIQGVDLIVHVEAQNPNRVDLSVQSVTASVKVDGRYDLGSFTQTTPITLAAKAKTNLDVPINLKWRDTLSLATLAASGNPIPYAIDGTVDVGGSSLHASLPFHLAGAIAHDDLVSAGMKSLPFNFPIDTLRP
jgi:LEA14-like dessication related protein